MLHIQKGKLVHVNAADVGVVPVDACLTFQR